MNRFDPYGLDWFDTTCNFWAGMGDSLSFGITGYIRESSGINSVDYNSTSYKAGEYTEIAVELGITLGAAVLKTTDKKTSSIAAQKIARRATRHIPRKGKILHHMNPLLGHPGGKKALFPTGGLPANIHSGRWNLKLLDGSAHLAKHRRLRAYENVLSKVVNPYTTTARIGRNIAMDYHHDNNAISATRNSATYNTVKK